MAPKQLCFVLLAFLPVSSSKELKADNTWWSGGGCQDTAWSTFCPKIVSKGLNRSGWEYSSTYNTCWVHSIETKSSAGKPQGAYMQKCMQEYCTRGECSSGGKGSFLLQGKKNKGWGKKKGGGMWGSPYMRPPKGNNWPKSPCADSEYYCAELCHNLYHPVMSDLGDHPGTSGCSASHCPNDDKCQKDCVANWDSMKEVYDAFCACEKEKGRPGKYPNGLLQETEEPEQSTCPGSNDETGAACAGNQCCAGIIETHNKTFPCPTADANFTGVCGTDWAFCDGEGSTRCVGNQCCPGTEATGGLTYPCPAADPGFAGCATNLAQLAAVKEHSAQEEHESVDVGAFIQTSRSDKKADEL